MWKEHLNVLRPTRPLLVFALLTAITAAAIPVRAEAGHGASSPLILVMHFGIQSTRYISSVLAIFLVLSAILYLMVAGNGKTSNVVRP